MDRRNDNEILIDEIVTLRVQKLILHLAPVKGQEMTYVRLAAMLLAVTLLMLCAGSLFASSAKSV